MPTETGYNGAFTGPQIDAALAKAQKAITEQELNEALGKLGGGGTSTPSTIPTGFRALTAD